VSAAALRRGLHSATVALVVMPRLTTGPALRVVTLVLFAVAALAEGARLASPSLARWAARVVPVYRPDESRRPSGAFWLAAGYGIAAWLPGVTPVAAAAGIAVAALADPAAAWVGSMFARSPGKSWVGSSAAFAVAWLALMLLGLPLGEASIGALVGALAERVPGPVNDNLVIAPAVALAVLALA
jgi:dolichol kinase